MRRLAAPLTLLAVLALALAGCGGTRTVTVTRLAPPACDPPVGQGHIGACLAHPPSLFKLTKPVKVTRAEHQIPDVYEGNGCPNWREAARYIVGAIYKVYESGYREDSCARSNAAQLNALHIWHATYVFDRANQSCLGIALTYVDDSGGRAFFARPDVGDPIVDAEVPSASANLACVVAEIHILTGRIVVIYSSEGTFPGGISMAGRLEWDAAFGPSPGRFGSGAIRVAWQHTGGGFIGPGPYSVPGIEGSSIDMSLDEGITSEHGSVPDPEAIYPTRRFRLAHAVRASEHNTARTWRTRHCSNPVKRSVCRSSRYHALLLRDRVFFLAHHSAGPVFLRLKRPRWGDGKPGSYGVRYQGLSRIVGR